MVIKKVRVHCQVCGKGFNAAKQDVHCTRNCCRAAKCEKQVGIYIKLADRIVAKTEEIKIDPRSLICCSTCNKPFSFYYETNQQDSV